MAVNLVKTDVSYSCVCTFNYSLLRVFYTVLEGVLQQLETVDNWLYMAVSVVLFG